MKQKFLIVFALGIAAVALWGTTSIWAQPAFPEAGNNVTVAESETAVVNGRISYQGYLTDPDTGDPLDGNYNMRFRFWDAASSGSQVGADIVKNGTAVANGLFNVTLDIPEETFDGQGRWLQIQVNGEWLNPRREIMPVPYALSLKPGALISGTVDGYSLGVINPRDNGEWAGAIYGRINSSADGSAAILGRSFATSGWSFGVFGSTNSTEGAGVQGDASAIEGIGVKGNSNATSGGGAGVLGITDSPDGSGVKGLNQVGGDGVHGWTEGGDGNGVWGGTDDPDSIGVKGENFATSGYSDGVNGIAHSPIASGVSGYNVATEGGYGVWGGITAEDGFGVKGENRATTGNAVGVLGETNSPDGMGIQGINNSATGWARGVSGESSSPDGVGVAGLNSSSGVGVYAQSTAGSALYIKSDSGTLIQAVSVNDADNEFVVHNNGNVYADGTYSSPAADFAEMMPAQSGLEPGDVLVIGADGQLTHSTTPYQTSVAGVYSTAPAFLGGAGEDSTASNNIPLAIVGIVPVKVTADNGAIQAGDLLTTSNTPGYAMLCQSNIDCIGAIIGKALEPLAEGDGTISVLITLQ